MSLLCSFLTLLSFRSDWNKIRILNQSYSYLTEALIPRGHQGLGKGSEVHGFPVLQVVTSNPTKLDYKIEQAE